MYVGTSLVCAPLASTPVFLYRDHTSPLHTSSASHSLMLLRKSNHRCHGTMSMW